MKLIKAFLYLTFFLYLLWNMEKMYSKPDFPYFIVGNWDVEASENEIIEAVKEIKRENPSLKLPKRDYYTKSKMPESLNFRFYYSDTKEIVCIQVTPTEEVNVKSIQIITTKDAESGKSKDINGGFGYYDTWRQIRKFENIIVDRLQKKIEEKRIAAHNKK